MIDKIDSQESEYKGEFTMGKVKTHKASAKRFSVTGSGKVKMNHCLRRHKTAQKSSKRMRRLGNRAYLSPSMSATIKTMIQK